MATHHHVTGVLACLGATTTPVALLNKIKIEDAVAVRSYNSKSRSPKKNITQPRKSLLTTKNWGVMAPWKPYQFLWHWTSLPRPAWDIRPVPRQQWQRTTCTQKRRRGGKISKQLQGVAINSNLFFRAAIGSHFACPLGLPRSFGLMLLWHLKKNLIKIF